MYMYRRQQLLDQLFRDLGAIRQKKTGFKLTYIARQKSY